ncbi:hypothetical protein JCM11641_006025 [Rhodosporidiobolus odoratus]
MVSLATSARRSPPPLWSEIRRFFVTLQRTPATRPGLEMSNRALTSAWTAGVGAGRRGGALMTTAARSTSNGLARDWRTGTAGHWARLGAIPTRLYSTCDSPGFPKNPQSPSPSPSSPPAPSDSTARLPRNPYPFTKHDSHALAKTEPHPLVKTPSPAYLSSLPRALRRAASSLPTPPGRPPTKDQLLALTNSFLQRLRIRFKWATIRSFRRFRLDDYTAFFSFGLLGTLGWFLLSTTSAFAVLFFVVNSLSLQEWLAGKLGAYLTQSTGMKVVFESAIVPKWGFGGEGSKIVFKNVYISRGPVKGELGVLPVLEEGEQVEEETEEEARLREMVAEWTHFHLSIATVEVSLSLSRWLDGKGLIKDAAVRGVRGVVERSHMIYDPDAPTDRFAYRNKPRPGDFWLEGLQIEDFLVTIYQPDNFRPYTFSIFNADIRRLRKQWLFYDFMSAESITGQVDNCLFSLHKPQSIGRTSDEDLKDARWSRMSRFRVDGVPIDHMQSSADTGVMSWLTSGRFDMVADIRFPREQDDELDLSALVDHLVDEIGGRLGIDSIPSSLGVGEEDGSKRIPGRQALTREALEAPKKQEGKKEREERKKAIRFAKETNAKAEGVELDEEQLEAVLRDGEEKDKIVSIDLDIRFKDLKASVPYFTSDLSYVNNALIRPIVAFINRNRTLVPIRAHIDLGLSEFNGSWTTYDVGILERMSEQVYAALAHHVQHSNEQRFQTVGLWTLQMTANSVLSSLRHNLTLAPY